jgi:hypothetical protein
MPTKKRTKKLSLSEAQRVGSFGPKHEKIEEKKTGGMMWMAGYSQKIPYTVKHEEDPF